MTPDDQTLRRLMSVGQKLLSELEPDVVFQQILEQACAITGARYAALGVLNEERTEIGRFLTLGIDAEGRRRIGDPPRGRGVLGVLIADPHPLRLGAVGDHPQSFGFPPGHPPMGTFLGVPIMVRDRAWGNLYLTEKQGGKEFSAADEDAALILAQFAATAIENSRLYQQAERGRQELVRAVRGLEAARTIADAISSEPEIERILELVVKRGRALIDAQLVLILLRDADDLVVAAGAGATDGQIGRRFPVAGSPTGHVLDTGIAIRATDVRAQLPVVSSALKLSEAQTGLIVPMSHRGSALGVLMAFDRGSERAEFTDADEQLLGTFAASAANAVALSRTVEAGRLRSTISSAEAERRRWARELHDETLQSLGGLRVLLASNRRQKDPEHLQKAINQAVDDIDQEIKNLRAIITDLRPSLLDDLGLGPALEALVERRREDGLAINAKISLPNSKGSSGSLAPELETTIYRLVQESLTNVVKHARARNVQVAVGCHDHTVEVEVVDDGVGFNPADAPGGFGLTGMRERIYLAGGTFEIASADGGTCVRVRIPTDEGAAFGQLGLQQTD